MKDLRFICVQPSDNYFVWQVHLWLESLRNIGHSDKATVLIFNPKNRSKNTNWQKVIDLYPESEFAFYDDLHNINSLIRIYIPIIRPYCLMRHFNEHPELKEKAIFYCDSDVIFTENFNIDAYKEDDICYLSNTNSYINASYFDSKTKDVLPDKLEEYKKKDILQETTVLAGINRQIAEENNSHSGGAQYFLKNIDGKFWEKVLSDCISIRLHLQNVNKQFFESESKGFQSWCADMWSVLYTLWYNKLETKVIAEMDFAWATDPIQKLDRVGILHNAGIVSDRGNGYPAFYKGKYHTGTDPLKDPYLQEILNSEESKKFCTHYYLTKLFDIKQKYNINY